MRRRPRGPFAAAPWVAMLVVASACGFPDPLHQAGLGVLLTPRDSALYVGAHFQARGLMVNSYGDEYPSAHFWYAGADPSASVDPGGTVTGIAIGRARVVANRAGMADTGWVSVVPAGTLALSSMSDQSHVVVVNVDGSGFATVVPSGQSYGGAPAWLPGNAGFVYQYAIPGGAGTTELFVTDLAGNSHLLATFGSNPRVSHDGAWVYTVKAEIWRLHPDGSGLERVTGPAPPFSADVHPDPSPDGAGIVFATTRFSWSGFTLATRVLATGVETPLGVQGLFPRWAPDGGRIAYLGDDPDYPGASAVFVINADGTGVRRLSDPTRHYQPQGLDWSPDGEWLLARSENTLDLIQVSTGLTLPLGFTDAYFLASWKR